MRDVVRNRSGNCPVRSPARAEHLNGHAPKRAATCASYNNRYNGFMFTAKVTTVGNSLGIVLPREILARLRVEKGDLIFLVESPLGFEMTPYEPGFAAQLQQAEQLMRAERNVLRFLADTRQETRPVAGALPSSEPE